MQLAEILGEKGMYERFRALPVLTQVIVMMVLLIAAWVAVQIVLGIVRALIPVAILAVMIVGLMWLFDKVRS